MERRRWIRAGVALALIGSSKDGYGASGMPVIAVYLASDFGRHVYVEEVARALALNRRDIVVVSRWHGTPGDEEVAGEGTTKAYIPPRR